MTLGEKLKINRMDKKLSQEKVAELIGVSRQAVTKWESNQTAPSSDNLMALASIYGVSIDELAEVKNVNNKKGNKILQSNLTLIAIILQATALNVCIQPLSTESHGSAYTFLLLFKVIPLLACSIWVTRNLKYEKNIVQYQKNIKIELLYCLMQLSVAMFAFLSNLLFLGAVLIISGALIYILLINPKYMNRKFTNRN